MDIKLAHDLESVDQDPLFLVLFNLRKAHNNLDHGRLIKH